MNKLKLFRIIGESFAKAHIFSEPGPGVIGTRKVDKIADRFFTETTNEMYPTNKRCREWAQSNMRLFYIQEIERMEIIKRLSSTESPAGGPRINQTLRTMLTDSVLKGHK